MLIPRSATRLDTVDRGLLQHRVANVGFVLSLIGLAFLVMRVIAILAVGQPERLGSVSMVAHYGGIAASLAMWLACRTGKLSSASIHVIELVGLTAVCCLYAVMAADIPQAFRPEMTLVLAFGVFLLAHAVHVPSSWQWTTLLGAALAVPLLVAAWMILNPMDPRLVEASASAAGSVQRSATSIIGIGVASVITWWLVIVATAAAASSVIYGLRREVREAQQLGQYTLERKLGEGSMGVVYLANHAMLRRPTAVKVLLPERMGETNLARFEREVRATARLVHPNTVTIFDYGHTADGYFYYAMELLDGASLEEVITHMGPMPPGRVVHILYQIAGALTEAHSQGIFHRDIKPANVMLTEQGGAADVAKVVDFGLVKTEEGPEDPGMTADNAIVGTPQFLAPEVILGHRENGAARDLYALGCVGYYLLAGTHVFSGDTLVQVCALHLEAAPEPLSKHRDTPVPEDLERLILDLLAKEIRDRPPSAVDLRSRLEACTTSCGEWTQADARTWWREHGPRLRELRLSGHPVDAEAATALAVDLHHRDASEETPPGPRSMSDLPDRLGQR